MTKFMLTSLAEPKEGVKNMPKDDKDHMLTNTKDVIMAEMDDQTPKEANK